MDIDVNRLGVDIKNQEIIRLCIIGNQLVVAGVHRLVKIRMTHVTAVDKEILHGTALAGILGLANETANLDERRLHSKRDELLVNGVAKHRHNALPERATCQLIERVSIVDEGELNTIVNQCQFLKLLDDIAQLHLIAFQELAPSRDIKEQILYHEIAAHRTHIGLLRLALRGIDNELSAQLVATCTGAKLDVRDSRYRSQRLTTKSHGVQREQVAGIPDLRGAVSLKRQSRIGVAHSHAIVNHLDQGAPGILEHNLHLGGLSVNSILHQLLDYRSRSLNHLTSSNLVGNRIGQ